jgi:hypothetical protein
MFQNYGVFDSAGPNHEAVPCRFDDCSLDEMKVVHTQNSLDLSEKSSQEPRVSSGHRIRLAMTSGMSCPSGSVTPAGLHRLSSSSCTLRRIERTELTHKTNTE